MKKKAEGRKQKAEREVGRCCASSPLHPFTSSPVHFRARSFAAILIALSTATTGCIETGDLPTEYGQRTSGEAGISINGTGVLGGLFEQAGHRVVSRRYLSPSFRESADAIVWFPDDFNGPPTKVREWLDEWLAEQPGRTLIYVSRDFDAEPAYWRSVQPLAPPAQQKIIAQRLLEAETRRVEQHAQVPLLEDNDWFEIRRGQLSKLPSRAEAALPDNDFHGEWARDIDWTKTQIEVASPIWPPDGDVVLLRHGMDILVSRHRVPAGSQGWLDDDANSSQIIVVANGSFLVNAQLVNHEHRKLAAKLVEEIGPPVQRVIFLESEQGGPPVHETDPTQQMPGGLELFGVWPLGPILLHLAAVGIIFCFARWPIFGLPRDPARQGLGDFGQHLRALGELLSRTRDQQFAQSKVTAYEQAAHADKPGWLKRSARVGRK